MCWQDQAISTWPPLCLMQSYPIFHNTHFGYDNQLLVPITSKLFNKKHHTLNGPIDLRLRNVLLIIVSFWSRKHHFIIVGEVSDNIILTIVCKDDNHTLWTWTNSMFSLKHDVCNSGGVQDCLLEIKIKNNLLTALNKLI